LLITRLLIITCIMINNQTINLEKIKRKWERNLYNDNTTFSSYTRLLHKHCALINHRDVSGRTVLHLPWNYIEYKVWLRRGANPNITDIYNNTALNQVIQFGNRGSKIVKLFIKYGGKINIDRDFQLRRVINNPNTLKILIRDNVFGSTDYFRQILSTVSFETNDYSFHILYENYAIPNLTHEKIWSIDILLMCGCVRNYIRDSGFICDILPLMFIRKISNRKSETFNTTNQYMVISYLYDIVL
jgi:hypothetical protein